jgi:hypothetical protein
MTQISHQNLKTMLIAYIYEKIGQKQALPLPNLMFPRNSVGAIKRNALYGRVHPNHSPVRQAKLVRSRGLKSPTGKA